MDSEMTTISHHDLAHVIQSRHGDNHFLLNVAEETDLLGRSFPPGTRLFVVEHESSICTHSPRCHWFGFVYWYQGCFTLVKDTEMASLTLRELLDRVTGASDN